MIKIKFPKVAAMILVISYLVLGFSCNTLKHDQKEIAKIAARNRALLAGYCADTYPVLPGRSDSLFSAGSNVDYTDSLDVLNAALNRLRNSHADAIYKTIVLHDTPCYDLLQAQARDIDNLKDKIRDLRDRYKPCVPDTLLIHDTIPDLAKIDLLRLQIQSMGAEHSKTLEQVGKLEKKLANRNYVIIGMSIIIAVGGYLTIKK